MDFDPGWASAIAGIETGGQSNPYTSVTPSPGGRRALGKYQVMAENVPDWTHAALGQSLTPEQFLNNPDAQEAVFKHRFSSYVDKYGTPQDAASAWFTGRPISASSASAHDALGTSGASYVNKFNAALDGPTAIQHAMHTQGGNGMPMAYADDGTGALSPQAAMGPGVLAAGSRPATQADTGLLGGIGYGGTSLHNRLLSAGAALQSVYNPQGAAVLAAQVKAATPTDQFTTTALPDGTLIRVNTKTGAVEKLPGNYAKDETSDKWKAARIASNSALSDDIDKSAASSKTQLGQIGELKQLLQDPSVYQGAGGESVAKMKNIAAGLPWVDQKGLQDSQSAQAIMNQLTLGLRNFAGGMPGSLSDKDVAFLQKMGPSLNNQPEANQRILDMIGKVHQRNLDVQKQRDDYLKSHGGMLDDNFRTQIAGYAHNNPLFPDQPNAQSPAASTPAPAAPKQLKTTNGVTWSIN